MEDFDTSDEQREVDEATFDAWEDITAPEHYEPEPYNYRDWRNE